MPTYRVTIGNTRNDQVEIMVVGDSPEHARMTCLRAGLVVASVHLVPVNVPLDDSQDDPIRQVRDELRQLKAAVDASSKSLHARTGVWTVVGGILLTLVILMGVAILFRIAER